MLVDDAKGMTLLVVGVSVGVTGKLGRRESADREMLLILVTRLAGVCSNFADVILGGGGGLKAASMVSKNCIVLLLFAGVDDESWSVALLPPRGWVLEETLLAVGATAEASLPIDSSLPASLRLLLRVSMGLGSGVM